MIPRVLAIAGSDSGGGAGIQADIKTITMLGGHAMTAVTAITAQNTLGVDRILPVPADMVIAQIDAVARDIGVDAVKIGMLGSAEVAQAIASSPLQGRRAEARGRAPHLLRPAPPLPTLSPEGERALAAIPMVFDPVMIASSGAMLADPRTIAAYEALMARATLVTPNLPELALLTGGAIDGVEPLAAAAHALSRRIGAAVLAKGGHGAGDILTDILVADGVETRWSDIRIDTRHSHGTGCTLSSAIATGLGAGMPLIAAIERARRYVRAALEAAPGLGEGHGPMGHGLGRAHFPSRPC